MADWEDSDDELEAFLTTRPQAPRSALIEGGSLIAAHAAQRSEQEDAEAEGDQQGVLRAVLARDFTLPPPPVGWTWAGQSEKLRLNADGATTADIALTKVLHEIKFGVAPAHQLPADGNWTVSREAVFFWNGDLALVDYLSALLDADIDSFALDVEFCQQVTVARPRPGGKLGGKVATLNIAHEVPIQGFFVHVIWLPAYEILNALLPDVQAVLEELLDCKTVIGVNVKADITRLKWDFDITPSVAVEDCMTTAKAMFGPRVAWNPHSKWGLADLSERLLGKPVCKGETLSNWEMPLTCAQVIYAGSDVLSTLLIHHQLISLQEFQCGIHNPIQWAAKVDGRARRVRQLGSFGGVVNDGIHCGLLLKKGSAALARASALGADAGAGNFFWVKFPDGHTHTLDNLIRFDYSERVTCYWFEDDFADPTSIATPNPLFAWCCAEMLLSGRPEVDHLDAHATAPDPSFVRSLCVIHGLRWFESNRSLFQAGRDAHNDALADMSPSSNSDGEGPDDNDDDDDGKKRKALRRKNVKRKLAKQCSTRQREVEVKMKADVHKFKNQPFGPKEKLAANLMLKKWNRVYGEKTVAVAWHASWVVPGTVLCRASLNPTGGLANDNQGLEAINGVQKIDQNFVRTNPTTFLSSFTPWLHNRSSEDRDFASCMDYSNKSVNTWNTAFFKECVEQFYSLQQNSGFFSVRWPRRLAGPPQAGQVEALQVLDVPSRRIVTYLTEDLPAHQRVKSNDNVALKKALMHTHPCSGRGCIGCSDSWYSTYLALYDSGAALPTGMVLDFDLYIDFATAFHTLTPMLDPVRVHALIRRLEASKMVLNLTKLGSTYEDDSDGVRTIVLDNAIMKRTGFSTCNCGPFLHTNWCVHVCVDAMVKGLIYKLPRTFRVEIITAWRAGRIPNAVVGGARGSA